jgi:hypothetical protein
MSYNFQSTLHPTSRAMCDAIAYEWMTAGGNNGPAIIDAMIADGVTTKACAEECIEGWNLLEESPTGANWLADRDSSAAEVLEAFDRFFATRPDQVVTTDMLQDSADTQ